MTFEKYKQQVPHSQRKYYSNSNKKSKITKTITARATIEIREQTTV